MNYYLTTSRKMDYPVGDNIFYNRPFIKEMAECLLLKLQTYNQGTPIVLFCTGSSGAIISAIIADFLIQRNFNITIWHLKKHGEDSHASRLPAPFMVDPKNVLVIVDDFISSGATIKSIILVIEHARKRYWENQPYIKPDILCVTGNIPYHIEEQFQNTISSNPH